jgi:hypothetical protein
VCSSDLALTAIRKMLADADLIDDHRLGSYLAGKGDPEHGRVWVQGEPGEKITKVNVGGRIHMLEGDGWQMADTGGNVIAALHPNYPATQLTPDGIQKIIA